MLVDLARNDLGRVCVAGSVRPTELMEVERFTKVMHIVSTVEGELREELHPLDALAVTFPAGTVTGAPKRRAMELIAEHEPTARGPYAGAVGYLTFAGDLDFCITIRTAVIVDGRVSVQTGAGVVADSDPESELRETKAKAAALLPAVAPGDGTLGGRADGRGRARMILIVDHYDSFTYNLVQLVESLGRPTEVVKSDAEPAEALVARTPDAVILSPGPGTTGGRGRVHVAPVAPAGRDPGARRVPRPSGARRGVRRGRGPRDPRARQGVARLSTRARGSSRASPIRSRPGATTRWSCSARRSPTSWS